MIISIPSGTRQLLLAVPLLAIVACSARAQVDPLDFVEIITITDNNPLTNELGRDRVSINSTPFKNQSIVSAGTYQFTTFYRDDGRLLIARRDRREPGNDWDIASTEFTSYNINDAHNVPVLAVDGDGYMHLSWGMHGNNLLYTRSTSPVTSGAPMSFTGGTVGNSAAINTMTGMNETSVTYPNFLNIPGTDDLLFNYRTGSSGNGTYRISRWDDATDLWTFTDERWIEATDPSGLTYNAYPHNMSYDSDGGLHTSWTFRYNSSSPAGQSGYQTNHNIHYAFSPDDGVTWYRDPEGTIPYTGDINDQTSEVIVPIPEGSSLINTGTQSIDANGHLGIATWWAPQAQAATPDHRRQYMFVGYDGSDWNTSQITHRLSDNPNSPTAESQLGVNHMGRPQIVFDDYNRAYVIFKDNDRGGGVTVAVSQAESRDDWEFIDLTSTNLGYYEPTIDLARWESARELNVLIQTIDGNSSNGGSPMQIIEWNAAAAMGRVIKWTGQNSTTWDTSTINFSHLGSPDEFDSYDNVTFDDSSSVTTITLDGNIDSGKVVIDSTQAYEFTGPGSLTSGSLSVVGGGSLNLATSGNSYAGPTRVSNATLTITGNANDMLSTIIVAAGGTVVMDATDAGMMASRFEIWSTGVLEIGRMGSSGNVFPDNPTSILNDGLIRVNKSETIRNVTGLGTIEATSGTITLLDNGGMSGGVHVGPAAHVIAANLDGLGSDQGRLTVASGGQLQFDASGNYAQELQINGNGGGNGALQISAGLNVTFGDDVSLGAAGAAIHVATNATATLARPVTGTGPLTKLGTGTLHLTANNNNFTGETIVEQGTLIVDTTTGQGNVLISSGGTFASGGLILADLSAASGATVRVESPAIIPNGVLYEEHFGGSGQPLNGQAPDTVTGGESWSAHPAILDNGLGISIAGGASGTLPFAVEIGHVYTLDATFTDVTGDNDWLAIGFVEGLTTGSAGNGERFIADPTTGKAWMLFRGDNSGANTNQILLGNESSGTAQTSPWPTLNTNGGDIDLRIVLDTTNGAGNYTAEFFARQPGIADYALIASPQDLMSENINAVGFAVSQNDVIGNIEFFRLMRNDMPMETDGLVIDGDFVLSAGSAVEFDIFGPASNDHINIGGTFTAMGALLVSLDAGAPELSIDDSFDLFDAPTVIGIFEYAVLPTLGEGLLWDTSQLLADGILQIVTGVAGDFNDDGVVDVADYTMWRDSLGEVGVGLAADADYNFRIDTNDFNIWRANFGNSISIAALDSAHVPEPDALAIVVVLPLLVLVRFAMEKRLAHRIE